MDKNSLGKKLTFSQLEGSNKKGKPKLRQIDDALQELQTIKVTTWWKKAQDRDSWKGVIKVAKSHEGL
jgi:lysophospholipid acyltransferase (LPLAT)-like uncharacterized protein